MPVTANIGKTMKAILEFDLPDEQYEFHRAVEGRRWQWFAHDFNNYLRAQEKYNESLTDDQAEMLEKIREEFFRLLSENNLSLDVE